METIEVFYEANGKIESGVRRADDVEMAVSPNFLRTTANGKSVYYLLSRVVKVVEIRGRKE